MARARDEPELLGPAAARAKGQRRQRRICKGGLWARPYMDRCECLPLVEENRSRPRTALLRFVSVYISRDTRLLNVEYGAVRVHTAHGCLGVPVSHKAFR